LHAYNSALDAFASALERELASPSLNTDPPIIKSYAEKFRILESALRTCVAALRDQPWPRHDSQKTKREDALKDAAAALQMART
jgi:hypothetical protein